MRTSAKAIHNIAKFLHSAAEDPAYNNDFSAEQAKAVATFLDAELEQRTTSPGNGGSIFPILPGEGVDAREGGLTLRDYFAAHAPTHPQPWFTPVLPPLPERPNLPDSMTREEELEMSGWDGDALSTEELRQPRVRAYAEASDAYYAACQEREAIETREQYLQWPGAWADEQLRRRAV